MTAYRACPGLDMSELVRTWAMLGDEARAAGRDPAAIRFAHQDHLYIDRDPTPDRLRAVLGRFSFNRYEDTAPLYLMGHPEELIPRFQARIDAGVEELTFNLLAPDPRQLDLFMKEIRPHLRPREPRSATPLAVVPRQLVTYDPPRTDQAARARRRSLAMSIGRPTITRRTLLTSSAVAGLVGALDSRFALPARAAGEKITFAAWAAAVDQVKAHITAFEKETGITVEYINAPWAQYRESMVTKLAANARST